MRREFTRAQRAQIIKRASDEKGRIWCEGCGLNITGKVVEVDHIVPEAMRLPIDKLKPLTIEEGQALGRDCCHRSPDGKTAKDLADIAEAKRREAFHLGVPSASRLRGAGFRPQPPQRKASRPLSPEKQLPPRRIGGEP